MCKWKDIFSGVAGLVSGCLLSGFIVMIFLSCFVNYVGLPLNGLPNFFLAKNPTHEQEKCVFIAVLLLLFVVVSGIFFTTFVRELAESLRDYIKNKNVEKRR